MAILGSGSPSQTMAPNADGSNLTKSYMVFILVFTALTNIIVRGLQPYPEGAHSNSALSSASLPPHYIYSSSSLPDRFQHSPLRDRICILMYLYDSFMIYAMMYAALLFLGFYSIFDGTGTDRTHPFGQCSRALVCSVTARAQLLNETWLQRYYKYKKNVQTDPLRPPNSTLCCLFFSM